MGTGRILFRETARFTERRPLGGLGPVLGRLHLDGPLLAGLLGISVFGLFVLYSAVGQNADLLLRQVARLCFAVLAMLIVAQLTPALLRRWTPWGYLAGLLLLALVLVLGDIGKGAQRWLDLGVRFQPSEIMKLAVPMMAAAFLHSRPLPPRLGHVAFIGVLILLPAVLIAVQPDLGTALLITAAGVLVLVLAGLSLGLIVLLAGAGLAAMPVLWHFMHDYQRQRVLTLLDPQSDPLGAGYNIIQSKIAIGSGGLFGKGWTNGSQAQLEFLPEKDTDFIFAVLSEEFGLLGVLALLLMYLFVVGRGLYIAANAQDTFSRLLAGSISLTFFVYVFVNTAMVCGLIPVVGVPLPLVSFGGTSMVTLMAGFGILMSVHTHRKLLPR